LASVAFESFFSILKLFVSCLYLFLVNWFHLKNVLGLGFLCHVLGFDLLTLPPILGLGDGMLLDLNVQEVLGLFQPNARELGLFNVGIQGLHSPVVLLDYTDYVFLHVVRNNPVCMDDCSNGFRGMLLNEFLDFFLVFGTFVGVKTLLLATLLSRMVVTMTFPLFVIYTFFLGFLTTTFFFLGTTIFLAAFFCLAMERRISRFCFLRTRMAVLITAFCLGVAFFLDALSFCIFI
jgi:hypothetical protein